MCDFDAGLAATLRERFIARLAAVRTATGLSDAELGLARVFPEPVYNGPVYAGPTSTGPTDTGAVSALTSAEDLHHTAATADPLAAVPVLVKDLHQVAGQVTSFGSHHHARMASHHDARVEALLARGAQLVGMTSTAEFGTAAYTEPVGSPAPINPLGEQFMCGGSSGGAAVAVAHGIVPVAHATDGGGSIRIPAACVGLPALKPAHVAFDPLQEGFSPVAQGFITQDFAWLRHAGTMAGPIGDTHAGSPELASTTLQQRLRIGVTTQPFHAAAQVDPRISHATQLAGQVLLQHPETLSVTPTQAPYPALPVLECIDSVSDVGGVDQAPQYVVVEVAESQGDAA